MTAFAPIFRLLAAPPLATMLSAPAFAQAPKKADPAWLAALAKATCVAMLTDPAKAKAIGEARGYEADDDGNLSFKGTDTGLKITVMLVPLRNPNLPLTYRQCYLKLQDSHVDGAGFRREIEAAFKGVKFTEAAALPGLKGWSTKYHAIGDKEIVFHVLAEAEGSTAGLSDGIQVNRVK